MGYGKHYVTTTATVSDVNGSFGGSLTKTTALKKTIGAVRLYILTSNIDLLSQTTDGTCPRVAHGT